MDDSAMKGLVVKSTGSWYDVRFDDGNRMPCRLRGQFRLKGIKNTNPVVVGDVVETAQEPDGSGIITGIMPRRNFIERKSTKLSKISHVIAANIDVLFLMVTLKEPRTSPGFIDRFLVSAEGFRIPVCLVFNKMDLYTESERETVAKLTQLYAGIGYGTLHTSIVTGVGIEELRRRVGQRVCMFGGHSGTGKSALINALAPELQLRTGEISRQHLKGQHTTTFAEMFPLADGFVVDTPGIKEFGLIQYSKEEVRDYFPEIRKYNNCCRFDNCIHVHEPGCAVREAVKQGVISPLRYQNYLSIIEDEDMKLTEWQLA